MRYGWQSAVEPIMIREVHPEVGLTVARNVVIVGLMRKAIRCLGKVYYILIHELV